MKTDREKLIEFVNEAHEYCNTINCIGGEECGYDGQLYCFEHLLIDYLISKGVTIPVRCGECKYYFSDIRKCDLHSEMPDEYSSGFSFKMEPTDFCSYGERE